MPPILNFMRAAIEMTRSQAEIRVLVRRYGKRRAVEVFWLDAYGGSLN